MSKLKRLTAPKSWHMERKTKTYVILPRAGTHSIEWCLSLGVVLRDKLKIAEDLREVKELLNRNIVKVDGIVRKEHRFPVGLMDVVSIEDSHYRLMPGIKGLYLQAVSGAESKTKMLKITNKTTIDGAKQQLHFHDGRNIIVDKDIYKTGDVVIYDLENKKISGFFQLKAGAFVLIIRGKNIGVVGRIEDVIVVRSSQPNRIKLRIGEKIIETLKDYVFVIGQEKPEIRM